MRLMIPPMRHVWLIALGIAIAFGLGRLTLSAVQQRLAMRAAVGGAYINLVGSLLAASWGTNRLTPMAGTGFGAGRWQEALVQVIQVSQAIALLVALGIVVYGLRRNRGGDGAV